jgi:nicotinate-nucleotide adenylyltransferase
MNEDRLTKVGLFGGTFDPIHLGHLRAAEEIREILGLEKIYFVPASVPPHKTTPGMASPHDRLKMLELAVNDNNFFSISDVEIKRGGKSYTIDTLRYFSEMFPLFNLYLIAGSDLFSEIDSWKDYKEIFRASNFVVIERPGLSFELPGTLPLEIKNDFRYYKEYSNLTLYINKNSRILSLVKIDGLEISSTKIRELVKKFKSIKYLVPSSVETYILEHRIYKKEAAK